MNTTHPMDNQPTLSPAEMDVLQKALLIFDITREEFVQFIQDRQGTRRAGASEGIKERVLLSEVFGAFRLSLTKTPITAHVKLKESSLYTYEKMIDKFEAYCVNRSDGFLDALSLANTCDDFVAHLTGCQTDPLKPTTINKYVAVVRRFLQFVQFYYSTQLLPQPSFKAPNKALPLAISPKALRQFNDSAAKSRHALRLTFLLEFLLSTGLRRNEFRLVQLQDLDLDSCTVLVRHAKNNHERVVPFSPKFREGFRFYFRAYGIQKGEHYIYGHMDNPKESVTNSALDQSFRAMAEKVESYVPKDPIFGYRLHSLRHTYATYLLRQKVPLRVISQLLGHSSMRTTARYTVLDTEQLREEASPGFRYIEQLLGV